MRFEIELDDKGEFVGQLPTEIDAILKRIDATAHGRGYQKAAEEAKPQIAEGIKRGVESEIARLNVELPLERERFRQAQEELKALQTKYLDIERDGQKNLRLREEQHAQELVTRAEALKKRDAKIRSLVSKTLQTEALKAGAREEYLDDLETLLSKHVGFNDDMEPFVIGADGREEHKQGKPVSIAAFVKSFLDDRPAYRKGPAPRPGSPPGGRTYGQPGAAPTVDEATAVRRIEEGDRSPDAINALFEATRKRASA